MATSNPSSRNGRTAPSGRTRSTSPGYGARRTPQPRLTVWEKIKLVSGILTLLLIVGLSGGALYAGYILRQANQTLGSVESLTNYHPGGVTRIYSTDKDPSTGREYLLGEVYTHYKEYASFKEIPNTVKDATVSIEDERFYDHVGVDLWAIGRALYRNITEKRMGEGASTITQQLARTLVLRSQENTMARKIKEAMVAVQLERNYSKEQILEMYLNEVNYGAGAYGIKGAAKVYFNKPLSKLTLSEAALLVGLPKNPSGYMPYRHLDKALERRNVVLVKMAELGKASKADVDTARSQKPKLAPRVKSRKTRYLAPFFCNYVLDQLKDKFESTDDTEEDGVKDRGLSIYTTLNWQMQQAAEKAIKSGVSENKYKGVTEAALVSLEPKTGYIRAMVGGADFDKHQFNNAAQGNGRQPGSTFKAVVYSAAFMTGKYGPYSSVSNERVSYPGSPPYRPQNFDGRYGGEVTITRAVENSMNIPAVRVTNAIGVGKVVDLATKLGIPRDQFPAHLNLALALGACNATPLQMASIYSVFPNGGNRAHPMAIIRVVDSEGKVISEASDQPVVDKLVIPESVANDMSEIFRKTVTEGTARAATGIGDIANAHAKTGTTSERRDIWFAGYTPELSTVVWACGVKYVKKGKTVRAVYGPLEQDTFGGSTCGPMWVRFMKAAIPIQRQYPGAGRPTPTPTATAKAAVASGDEGDEPRPRRRYRRRRRDADQQDAAPAQATPAAAKPAEEEARPAENTSPPAPAEPGGESGGGEAKPTEAPPAGGNGENTSGAETNREP